MNPEVKPIDASLVVAFQAGSSDAYSKIYERFRKPIMRYISSRLSDAQVAEEVVQDIFLKVYRFRANYSPEYAFSTWLWSISKNTVSDFLRVTRNFQAESRFALPENLHPEELACLRPNAESLVIRSTERKNRRRNLLVRMKSLTRLQKRVLWMRSVHDLSDGEISDRLGLTLVAVKNLAYRAKQKTVGFLNITR